jgi:hypothetical protein
MYGKYFSCTFSGSMVGAGPDVFAIWGYIIANAIKSRVELNPTIIAVLIGMSVERVEAVIKYLESPDLKSRSKEHDGRRIIREGEYQYFIPTHEHYRRMVNNDELREYNRTKQAERRAKLKAERGKTIEPNAPATPATPPVQVSETPTSSPSLHPPKSPPAPESKSPSPVETSSSSKLDALQKAEQKSDFPGIPALVRQIKDCRPEFRILSDMAVENYLKYYDHVIQVAAVRDFVRDMTNALSVPNVPLKILDGYLRQEKKNVDAAAGIESEGHRAEKAKKEFKETINVPKI